MPRLLPFRGLRPNPAVAPLADVVCPPYDVIDEQQHAELVDRSPYNLVRIELPAGDYQGAAALLAQWKASGALRREAAPALYGYRMTHRDPEGGQHETLGVMGALVLEPPGKGILPHEQTTPKDKTDRLELIRATRANTSPIWCLCSEPGLGALLSGDDASPTRAGADDGGTEAGSTRAGGTRAAGSGPAAQTAGDGQTTGDAQGAQEAPGAHEAARSAGPAGLAASAVDDDGVMHEIWPIWDPAVHEAISKLTSAAPLLVADGHHRYETALTYLAEVAPPSTTGPASGPAGTGTGSAAGTGRVAGKGDATGTGEVTGIGDAQGAGDAAGPGAVLALVVELSEQYLQVRAIHRSVSGLPAGTDVLGAFAEGFELSKAAAHGPALLDEMRRIGAIAVVTSRGSFLAQAKPGHPSAAFELDSSRVDAALATLPPHQLSYEHDLDRALAGVRAGRLDAAVLCRPATVAQIAATAHGGERMPPKTTFFWPKPRTGMVLRDW
jgi:hypothetical protein